MLTDAKAGHINGLPLEDVYEAGTFVFAAIDEALNAIGEGTVLRRHACRDVWEGIEQARSAITEVATEQQAKRLQQNAAGGRPLTVCFGRRVRRILLFPGSSKSSEGFLTFGDGCGIVFADSVRDFARYCPTCRRKPGGYFKRMAIARRNAADEGRILVPRHDLDGNEVRVWRAPCSACGEYFETLQPRARRCPRCRNGHRARSHFLRT